MPPRREDLFRLAPGSGGNRHAVVCFVRADELEDVVSYVIHLSIRGKVEFDTIVEAFGYDAVEKRAVARDRR